MRQFPHVKLSPTCGTGRCSRSRRGSVRVVWLSGLAGIRIVVVQERKSAALCSSSARRATSYTVRTRDRYSASCCAPDSAYMYIVQHGVVAAVGERSRARVEQQRAGGGSGTGRWQSLRPSEKEQNCSIPERNSPSAKDRTALSLSLALWIRALSFFLSFSFSLSLSLSRRASLVAVGHVSLALSSRFTPRLSSRLCSRLSRLESALEHDHSTKTSLNRLN